MLNSLRARNIALMAGVLLAAQLLTMALVALLVIAPQADRVAQLLAVNVKVLSTTLDSFSPDQRRAYIDAVNRSGSFRILPSGSGAPGVDGSPTVLEHRTLTRLAETLQQQKTMVWRGGGGAPLWVRLEIGRSGPYWITLTPVGGWSPNRALVASIALALALSLIAGLTLQRRINRPLSALAVAVDAMPDTRPVDLLVQQAPAEIAAVADSFSRMANRLAEQEAERTLMLTGISHDLKTPLAKLRLALAIAPLRPDDLADLVDRQIDRLDAMLDQFLDFGQGLDPEAPVPINLMSAIEAAVAVSPGCEDLIIASDAADLEVLLRPLAFERALANILRNAQLYGKPPVTISIQKDGENAVVSVEDRGSGVPPAMLAKLDQPFFRVGHHRPSDGSVGLGLAIVRRFADTHGAGLDFANLDGGGFRVRLLLPLQSEAGHG